VLLSPDSIANVPPGPITQGRGPKPPHTRNATSIRRLRILRDYSPGDLAALEQKLARVSETLGVEIESDDLGFRKRFRLGRFRSTCRNAACLAASARPGLHQQAARAGSNQSAVWEEALIEMLVGALILLIGIVIGRKWGRAGSKVPKLSTPSQSVAVSTITRTTTRTGTVTPR
jgi:hypothetical protein